MCLGDRKDQEYSRTSRAVKFKDPREVANNRDFSTNSNNFVRRSGLSFHYWKLYLHKCLIFVIDYCFNKLHIHTSLQASTPMQCTTCTWSCYQAKQGLVVIPLAHQSAEACEQEDFAYFFLSHNNPEVACSDGAHNRNVCAQIMATCGLLSNSIGSLKQLHLDQENNKNFSLPVCGDVPRGRQLHWDNSFNNKFKDGGSSPDKTSILTQDKDQTQYETGRAQMLTQMMQMQYINKYKHRLIVIMVLVMVGSRN